jgi:hypothetical protein
MPSPEIRRAGQRCPVASPIAATPVSRVVLRVNDRIVTLYDYELRLATGASRSRFEATPRRSSARKRPQDVMRDFWTNLLLSRAEQLDVAEHRELDNAVCRRAAGASKATRVPRGPATDRDDASSSTGCGNPDAGKCSIAT